MDELVTEFVNVSGTDRRTARFFLERQHNDVNNALEDYFSHPDLTIPADYMREQTNNNDSESESSSSSESYSSTNYSNSSSRNARHRRDTNSHQNRRISSDSSSSNNEIDQQQEVSVDTPVQDLFPIVEVDSSAIISSEVTNITEKEENYFSNDILPFPKRKSKGKSSKVCIYSNGILLFDNFYDKTSSNEYSQIMKSLQCGFIPPDLASKHFIDIEICDLRSQEYSK